MFQSSLLYGCFSTALIAVAGVLATASPVPAQSQAADKQQSQIQISNINYEGAGCLPGTVTVELNQEKQTLTIRYKNLVARAQPGQAESTVACNVALRFLVPPNMRMAIPQVMLHGYADVPARAHARVSGAYAITSLGTVLDSSWWERPQLGSGPEASFGGEFSADVGGHQRWTPCGQSLDAFFLLNTVATPPANGDRGIAISFAPNIEGQGAANRGIDVHLLWSACSAPVQ